MKRLALLTITAFMALLISACGEKEEKKAEDKAATEVSQPAADDTKKEASEAAPAPSESNSTEAPASETHE